MGGPRGNLADAARQARTDARALVYQRKKKEENRSILQETLKRDFIKEKNYLIFQLREGEDRCSYDDIGEMLDKLGLTASDVVSIAENPYNEKEIEVLMKDENEFDVAEWSRKLDALDAPFTVNKMGKLEEVFIIRNLPLTLDQTTVKEWIKEAITPFVQEIHDITPLKHSRRKLNEVGSKASKFFEGKFDGNWRVAVTPKGAAEVPSFAVFGPQNLPGAVKYTKRGQPVNELCWSCYAPGHKRSDKDEAGKFICPGPKEWMKYVMDFQDKAAEISGKPAEDLFSFTDGGPIQRRMERELGEIADQLEKANKEKDAKEEALKEAREAIKQQIEDTNAEWQRVMLDQEKEFEEKLKCAREERTDISSEELDKMKVDMESMRVKLEETMKRNAELKVDNLELKKQNEELNHQSVEDSLEMADILEQNEKLVKMVTQGSTLDEIEDITKESALSAEGKLDDDPILTNSEVFKDGGENGRKHRLSPNSVDLGPPKEKQLLRTKSLEHSVIVRNESETISPSLSNPPGFPPPPSTTSTKEIFSSTTSTKEISKC